MTATTPEVLDETILEHLADLKTACEWQTRHRRNDDWVPCVEHAEWIARMMCAHGHQSMSLICNPHHASIVAHPETFACFCGHVGRPALCSYERI